MLRCCARMQRYIAHMLVQTALPGTVNIYRCCQICKMSGTRVPRYLINPCHTAFLLPWWDHWLTQTWLKYWLLFCRNPARPDAVLFPPGSPQVLLLQQEVCKTADRERGDSSPHQQQVCKTADREQGDFSPLQQQSHRTGDTEQQQSSPAAQRWTGFHWDLAVTRSVLKENPSNISLLLF